jgi:nucleotide-binding universal stress UspA family protein
MKNASRPKAGPATTADRGAAPGPAGEVQPAKSLFHVREILVPIDFSDCSIKALQYAVAFAREFGASLTLLYVVDIHFISSELTSIDLERLAEEMRWSGDRQLAHLIKQQIGAAVPADTLLLIGKTTREIVQAAKTRAVDLIIMGTHGREGAQRAIIGSTAEKVVRHAPCPVLVVRERERKLAGA